MNAVLHHAGEMLPWMLLTLPVYAAARFALRRGRGPASWRRELALLIFVLFCAGLASQTVMPGLTRTGGSLRAITVFSHGWSGRPRGFNLVPLRTIRQFWDEGMGETFLINIAGNVGMFMPLGFFPPLLWQRWRSWSHTALLGLAASCAVECLQIFTFRSVDVDDVLLNVLGALLGYGLWRTAKPRLDG